MSNVSFYYGTSTPTMATPYTAGGLYVASNLGLHYAVATNSLTEVATYVKATASGSALTKLQVNSNTYNIPQAGTATQITTTTNASEILYMVGQTSSTGATVSLCSTTSAFLQGSDMYVGGSKVMTKANSSVKAASNAEKWPTTTTNSNVYIIQHESGTNYGICSYSIAMSPQSSAYDEIWGSVTRLNYSGNYFLAIPKITLSSTGVASVGWYSATSSTGTVCSATGTTTIYKLIVTN